MTNPEAVKVILDSQGAITGNRPPSHIIQRATGGLIMALEDMRKSTNAVCLTTLSRHLSFLIDSSQNVDTQIWKHNRKAIHAFLNPVQLEEYLPKQQIEYVHFLHDILTKPKVSANFHPIEGFYPPFRSCTKS